MGALDTRGRPRRWPHHRVQSSRVFTGFFGPQKGPAECGRGRDCVLCPVDRVCPRPAVGWRYLPPRTHRCRLARWALPSAGLIPYPWPVSLFLLLYLRVQGRVGGECDGSWGAVTRPRSSWPKRDQLHTRALTYTYAECHASTIEVPRPSPGTFSCHSLPGHGPRHRPISQR